MKTDFFAPSSHRNPLAISLAGYAGALLLVALTTAAGLLIGSRWGNSPVVMLYLLPVLAAAIYAGLGPGLAAAAASALAYNYFFTAPIHTLIIHSAADIVTVAVLFLVAAVCSQLAASVRRQAQLASGHAARNATIAGFARRLLSSRDEAEVAEVSIAQFAQLFGCHGVVLAGDAEAQTIASLPQDTALSPGDLAAAAFTLASGKRSGRGQKRAPQVDWQFHPVISGEAVLAAVGLARSDGAPPVSPDRMQLFESLLDQMALALERARLDGQARETAALRARDRLRSVLLTSIGDDVKPRLKAIQAAVRALRRDGAADRALVAELEADAAKVERHIDNLVDVSPGADCEAIPFGDITIDLHRRAITRGGEQVHLTPKEFAVLAELAKHGGRVLTHAQLLRAVWGPAQQDHVDYLRVAVRALRQKLERNPANPALIMNEPGVGYRLVV
jgi:two-component system sensor histidine kinase KdpD